MTTFARMIRQDAALNGSGLGLMTTALEFAGIEVRELYHGVDAIEPMLTYELGDGSAFVIRGAGRNDYTVSRYVADSDDPVAEESHLNLAAVVRVLTFDRPLTPTPEFMPPSQPTRRRWFRRS